MKSRYGGMCDLAGDVMRKWFQHPFFTAALLFFFVGLLFSCEGTKQVLAAEAETVKEETDFRERALSKFTPLQILFAEKGVKLPYNNNPAVLHKFTADPCVLVYKDTVYIYGTNDSQQAVTSLGKSGNNYGNIKSLNVFSSKDLVNWTDCGQINVAGRNGGTGPCKWANNSWAPAICTKKIDGKDKFFLYFADNASGIGVLTADSPLGPFEDPLGKPLVSRSTPNTQGVYWMFDPAVLVDDDGHGYLYFGGGVQNDAAHPKSGRAVALGDDMISLAGNPVELDPPYLFEDSGINKIGNTYYYSYCSNWNDRAGATGSEVPPAAVIAYMTSNSPLGPYKYQGYTLKNPGSYFGAYGNNHHWIFEFNGRYYIAYHAQIVEKTLGFEQGGYRSLMINEFKINKDGSWPVQNAKTEGVDQVCAFNPFTKVPAPTMHSSRNLVVSNTQTVYPLKDKAYLYIKNAAFNDGGKTDATVTVNVTPGHKGGTVSFMAGHFAKGDCLARLEIKEETQKSADFTLPASNQDLYIVLEGDVELVSWELK